MSRTPFTLPSNDDIFADALAASNNRAGAERPATQTELRHFGQTGELPDRFYHGEDSLGRPIPKFGRTWDDIPDDLKEAILPATTTDAERLGLKPYPTQRDMTIAGHTSINDAIKSIMEARNRRSKGASGVKKRTFNGGLDDDPNAGRRY